MTRRGWNLPEREATPEHAFLNRRKFMKSAGLIGAGLVTGCGEERVFKSFDEGEEGPGAQSPPIDTSTLYPASANLDFAALDRPLTREDIAATYNNFYEFTVTKKVSEFVEKFELLPWTLKVSGLVEQPKTYDIDELIRPMTLEERALQAPLWSRPGRWHCHGRAFR